MEFVLEVKQSRKGCSDDDSSKAVSDEGYSLECLRREELYDVIFDLSGQPIPHLDDVSVCEFLV